MNCRIYRLCGLRTGTVVEHAGYGRGWMSAPLYFSDIGGGAGSPAGDRLMRLMVDSLIALMLAAILGGVLVYHTRHQAQARRYESVRRALASLQEQVAVHAAVDAESGKYEFPQFIAPDWFHGAVPVNVLMPGRHAWIDIAPPGDRNDHPPDPVFNQKQQAGFWYNPSRGIFRARVPRQLTEEDTLRVYNLVNGAGLSAIPHSQDPKRRPTPMPLIRQEAQASGDESASPATRTAAARP